MKIGIVDINLCAKNCQSIREVSRVMSTFANYHILASALPRSRKSGSRQFLYLDLVNNNVYTKCHQNISYCWTNGDFLIFHIFFASALPWSEKSSIWQVYWLDVFSIYQFAKKYQNIPNGSSAMASFSNCPWTDRRIHEVIIGHLSKANLSIGRIFCASYNNTLSNQHCTRQF